MKYNFIEANDIKSDYLSRHNLTITDIQKTFSFDVNEDVIIDFYQKIINNKDLKFLIVGDYDCDGICSVSIIKRLFNDLKIDNSYYIPSRLNEGYGLNKLIVDNAIKYGYQVILLVDNGVSCNEAIEYAYSNNIKVFIIDHHNYDNFPKCEAFIHQNLISKQYLYASAGELCFLLSLLNGFDEYNLILGALTILSDYINISPYNRYLLLKMFDLLNHNEFLPFRMLNDNSKFDYSSVTYNLIPKINSISRMETKEFNANHVVKFLLSLYDDMDSINSKITNINNNRKIDTTALFNKYINEHYEDKYILISDPNINEGYCSSLATKLSNYYDKPVFVFNENGDICKGSVRSQAYDIYHLLINFNNYISFGGHEHAVGLSIKKDNLALFNDYLSKIEFNEDENKKEDVYLLKSSNINDDLINSINSLGPFGNGYEIPLIAIRNNNYSNFLVKNKYPKFIISDNISAISFDEKYIGFTPEYIIGYIDFDSYKKGSYSILIKALI